MMQHGLGSHSLRPWFTGSGIIAAFASLVALALATPGDLDFAFGVNGVVTLDLSQEEDRAYAVAIQPDGKIVTVGRVTESAYQRFAIGRHIQNGKLDPEWCASGCLGKPGLVYFFCNQPDTTARYCQFNAVAVGKDGRVVAAGFDKPSFNANADFRVHGFNADGTTAFTTQIDFDQGDDEATAVTIQQDGKIVVVGNSALPNVARIAVARLLPTGALDTSFGGNGTGKRTFTFGGSDDRATSVLYASSIGILVGGYSKVGNNNFAMANLTSTGALAFTFGGGSGIVTTDLGGDDRAIAVLVTISPSKHRRIYLVGSSTTAPSGLNDFAVARYLANGSLDTKFADQGKVRVDFGKDDLARAAAVDSHLVIAGISQPQGGGPRQMAVTRMGWDGKLDASFGINGKVMTTFDSSPYPEVTGVTIQKDGKAVVAGSATVSTSGTGQDWKLVRYLVR